MPQPPKARKAAAARAREGKAQKKVMLNNEDALELSSDNMQLEKESDAECTDWTGGVNHVLSDSENDEDWEDIYSASEASDSDNDEDHDLEELEGQDLVEGLHKYWALELQELAQLTPYELLLQKKIPKEWKKAEAKRELGYNGLSDRRKREIAQKLRIKEEQDKVIREG
jgi:hypothetical protein